MNCPQSQSGRCGEEKNRLLLSGTNPLILYGAVRGLVFMPAYTYMGCHLKCLLHQTKQNKKKNKIGKVRRRQHRVAFACCLYLLGCPNRLIPFHRKRALLWHFNIAGNN